MLLSAQKQDHVVFNAYAGGAFDSLHSLLPGTMSENLAWGYRYPDYNTPFEGWYEEEKVLFDGAVASDPNLANMSAFEIYQANPTLFHQVGHYLNIVDGFMTTTGFAVSTEGGILPPTYQQSFGGNAVGETATTRQFRTDLNNFTAQKKAALETAKAISEIQPTMLSALCLMLYRGSELKEQFERGEFHPLSPGGLMHELHRILENVELPEHCHTIFRSNHVSNYVNFAGNLPKDKQRLLVEVQMAAEELDKLKTWDVYNDDRY